MNGKPFPTVFDLFGRKKSDIARAVGWTFSQCPEFLKHFVRWMMVFEADSIGEVPITLQMWGRPDGFTSLEIFANGKFHCFIHGAPSSSFPRIKQLKDYAARLRRSTSVMKCLIVFTDTCRIDAWASRAPRLPGVRSH